MICERSITRCRWAGLLAILLTCGLVHAQLTTDAAIQEQIKKTRPSSLAVLPRDLAQRMGTTHSNGMYHLTDKPFLVEGALQIVKLRFGVAKFWLSPSGKGYDWNSSWGDLSHMSLAQIVDTPYYKQALSQPFTTVIFELGTDNKNIFPAGHNFDADEAEIKDLTLRLLTEYHDRDITFVIQNWEGDWVFRGKEKDSWPSKLNPEVARRAQVMIRWFSARQMGVEAARAEAPSGKCKVLHAIEVNKVFESLRGIPTLANIVLTRVPVDMVSWSAWDAKTPVQLWQGIEILRKSAKPLAGTTQTPVYIGEIGLAENTGLSREQIRDWWDQRMAVLLSLNVPYIVYWELYCNEPKDHDKDNRHLHSADEMTGKWLIRPDGSYSYSLEYFEELLAKSNPKLAERAR